MWAGAVNADDEEADTVWALAVMLCVGLSAVRDGGDRGLDLDGAAVSHAGLECLLLEGVGEDTGVGREAGETEAKVAVEADDLLLV